MSLPGYAGYLRVYQPLVAFEGAERAYWEAYAAGDAPTPAEGRRRQRQASLASLVAPRVGAGGLDPEGSPEAYVLRVDGVSYVSPWQWELRQWLAAEEFQSGLPDQIAHLFIPARQLDRALDRLDASRALRPDLVAPHERVSTWQLPLRWFLLVDPTERTVSLGPERAVTYLTSMGQARRRVTRALQVLRRSFPPGPLVDDVSELARWLEQFHPYSQVELDYGDLVDHLSDEDLVTDDSAAEAAEALKALQDGHSERAIDIYRRAVERWQALHALAGAS